MSGSSCTNPCPFACVRMTRLIGAGPVLMASRCQAPGGQETGPNPAGSGQLGSKRHIVVDARGIPLVILVSGVNRLDSKMFKKCVDSISAVAGLSGNLRKDLQSCMPTRAMTTNVAAIN